MRQSLIFQQLLLCSFLLFFLSISSLQTVEARASAESVIFCSPLAIEPHQKSYCVVNVRDSQQEPTMAFNIEDFSVTAYSSVAAAALDLTPLRRGDDVTTIIFEVSASTGTAITINIVYASGTQNAPIRNSGLLISVLSWPAIRMGSIICDVPDNGLLLRSTTTCKAPLYDITNRSAVLHESDVTFVEDNNLGSFRFVSGVRNLIFNFTAVGSPGMTGSLFSLHVTLSGGNDVYSIKFPLLYPELYPVASYSTLICSNETVPIACTLRAADKVGPVRLNLDHFQILIDTLNEKSGITKWIDNTYAFEIVSRPLGQTDTAVLSWKLKVNNFINSERLHVFTFLPFTSNTGISSNNNNKELQEIRGSPFAFISGVTPNAAYVSLRGCRVSMITSGNRTSCFIDLQNGVSGDIRYFHLASTIGATFENITYLSMDPVFYTPVVSFIYHAPVVESRAEDFITLLVGGQSAIRSPFRMAVFPPRSNNGGEGVEVNGAHNAVIIGLGLAFFGAIVGGGSFLALQRSLRFNRIRHARAIRKAQAMSLENKEGVNVTGGGGGGGQVSTDAVPQKQQFQESDSE